MLDEILPSETSIIDPAELSRFLEAVRNRYGYDFRNYAMTSLKRRIRRAMAQEGVDSLAALQTILLSDNRCMTRFLDAISVDVSAMFRDPGFYKSFREKVAPGLRHEPVIRIWHAGSSTGKEVYSMAILLHEENLLHKAKLYATDMNERLLAQGKQAIYPMNHMREYTANYHKANGRANFSDYYTAKHGHVIMRDFLGANIVWAAHNLVTDTSFNEFHVIFCRNVMIYFNRKLQNRVHTLLYESLETGGVLGVGRGEQIQFTPHEDCYEAVDGVEKLYRKKC